MGQNVTSIKQGEDSNGTNVENVPNRSRERDFQYLMGRLESLPESARKLFNQGKQYLTTGLSDGDYATDGFCTLFQVYQPLRAADESPYELTSPSKELNVGILNTPMRRSAPLHHLQTYVQWKAAQDLNNLYSLCLPKRQTIYVQPISTFPDFIHSFRFKSQNLSLSLFETIQAFLQIFFSGLEVLQLPPISLEEFAGAVRSRVHPVTGSQQLCLNDLYPLLFRFLPPNGLCIMGISWTDIFPEGHNFALGEASVQDRSAVISFGRFETKGFDAKAHSDIAEINGPVIWKLIKSSSHELCHLLGLQHCTFFLCAMNESSSMDEAMNQPLFLCPVCLRKLQKACGFDVLERYTLLQKFLSGLAQQFTEEKFEECLAWLDRCVVYLNS